MTKELEVVAKRKEYGYIKHHENYIEEKMNMIIRRAENIKNMQNNVCGGFENETLSDLKQMKVYIDMFMKDYIPAEGTTVTTYEEDREREESMIGFLFR